MNKRTCYYCNNKIEDSFKNWYTKHCCISCYRNSVSLYKEGDEVYTYNNIKIKFLLYIYKGINFHRGSI